MREIEVKLKVESLENITKKLEEMGKKNGLDPNFMKETFGI